MSEATAIKTQGPKSAGSGERAKSDSSPWPTRLADALIVVAFLALVFLFGIFPNKDTDFWWHLKTGDWIRQNGQVPHSDFLTFGAEGHTWIDLHWMFQVLVSLGYQVGGTPFLNLAKCVVTTLGVGLIAFVARRREWPIWAIVLGWIPGLLVLSGRMYIRPETLTFFYMACTLTVLFHWERRPKVAFFLPLIMLFWVNSHALFVLGPILIGSALLDASLRRGAFAKERRAWWRTVLSGVGLAALACVINPYGLRGLFFPLELWGTMNDPVFRTIEELKPLMVLFKETGGNILPLQIHIATFFLAGLSFLLPLFWRFSVWMKDRTSGTESAANAATTSNSAKKKTARRKANVIPAPLWRLSIFRLVLFLGFSYLSLKATRNSHQYAAIMGTIMAWNVGEWVGAIRRRHAEEAGLKSVEKLPEGAGGRFLALATVLTLIVLVGSGQFYEWSGEKRTVGLGEEPLWFAHDATKFAGSAGMPDRFLCFHNGHAPLYEYYFGPEKKVFADARLEVMGPKFYGEYVDLSRRIGENAPGWVASLEALGAPVVLLDHVQPASAPTVASFLLSKKYRCVWYDPIASVFVHERYADIVSKNAVDFAGLHFKGDQSRLSGDITRESALATSMADIGFTMAVRPGSEEVVKSLALEGLDHARRVRSLDPGNINGWKRAAVLEISRSPSDIMASQPVSRFRMAFDPVFDLAMCRATYHFKKALEIDPEDRRSLLQLPALYQSRGMNAEAYNLYEQFLLTTPLNDYQRRGQEDTMLQAARMRVTLGDEPKMAWKNLSELESLENLLLTSGRATQAADLIEKEYRPEARTWEKTDRLATIRLHLGDPRKAREIWLAAADNVAPKAVRLTRVGFSYLIEDQFDQAKTAFEQAIQADRTSFDAHYGLALTQQDAGDARTTLASAREAERVASTPAARAAALGIVNFVAPYERLSASRPKE